MLCVATIESMGLFLHMSVRLMSEYLRVCFRGLEMLQEINQSENRRSSFSKLAMISLLNSNMSVKYSLTGHLTSTDIISDGFYDVGKVSVCVYASEIHVETRSFKEI